MTTRLFTLTAGFTSFAFRNIKVRMRFLLTCFIICRPIFNIIFSTMKVYKIPYTPPVLFCKLFTI